MSNPQIRSEVNHIINKAEVATDAFAELVSLYDHQHDATRRATIFAETISTLLSSRDVLRKRLELSGGIK